MKSRKIASIVLAMALSVSLSGTNVYATATSSNAESTAPTEESAEMPTEQSTEAPAKVPESSDGALMLGEVDTLDSTGPNVIVELPNAGDEKTIEMQIDHSVYPEALLYAFTHGGLGDCTITVSNGSSMLIKTEASTGSTSYAPKGIIPISGSGGVTNYTVTVSTKSGDASCALNLTTESTFAETCGGKENYTSIAKNVGTENGATHMAGRKLLLNGEGEWYRYTADGDTYIYASGTGINDFVITVYDADTNTRIGKTNEDDQERKYHSSTFWTHCCEKLFELESGHDYLIRIQSSSKVSTTYDDKYSISVGLPMAIYKTIDVKTTQTYSIPANTAKTFMINVSGEPNSSRLGKGAIISFRPSSIVDNVAITSLRITAPNGKVLTGASYGDYTHDRDINFDEYLTGPDNITVNGTWKVTITANKAISKIKFSIYGSRYYIPGQVGK